jgi:hypothetical protein
MALAIPVSELGGDAQVVGVYATTSRRRIEVLDKHGTGEVSYGRFVQVGRQGNPLFNEALVAIVDKDLYSRTSPTEDETLFKKYALTPELAHLSKVQTGFGNGVVPGGWPNGRRFGDDVIDIAVTAVISDLRVSPPVINGPAGDNVDRNDMAYNKVFPYESTPQNGRNHTHP